jgi:hypothetical protein
MSRTIIPVVAPVISHFAAAVHAKPIDVKQPQCAVCEKDIEPGASKAECTGCSYEVHSGCLDLDLKLTKVVAKRTDWFCNDCKYCHQCGEKGHASSMLLCDLCDNGLHLKCALPKLTKMPKGEVRCNDCQPSRKSAITKKFAGARYKPMDHTVEEGLILERGRHEAKTTPEIDVTKERPDQTLEFGRHTLRPWYHAPILAPAPEEYQFVNTIHMCEYCLCMQNSPASIARHRIKCKWRHPPGVEIYRNDRLSFFQVDGRLWSEYCQNLCVLSKCFLRTKTLFYDVQTFLFYVLVEWDVNGAQLIGYFSKEKQPDNNYNLSCLMTLPHQQRKGYGKVLIDFSYLLSRREGTTGSPERPLSDLGLLSYRSYWLEVLADKVAQAREKSDKDVLIKTLSTETGIEMYDIISTLQDTRLVKYSAGEHWILTDHPILEKHGVSKATQMNRPRVDERMLAYSPWQPTAEDLVLVKQHGGPRTSRSRR